MAAAPASPPPVGPYLPAVRAGEFLFCSGQLGLVDGALVEGVSDQLRVAIERLAAVLAEHGASLGEVVRTSVYLCDMAYFAEMNEAYIAGFAPHRPARSAIGVSGLPLGAAVEIDAVAYLGPAS